MKMYNCSLDNDLIDMIEKLSLETGFTFNELLNAILRFYFIGFSYKDLFD